MGSRNIYNMRDMNRYILVGILAVMTLCTACGEDYDDFVGSTTSPDTEGGEYLGGQEPGQDQESVPAPFPPIGDNTAYELLGTVNGSGDVDIAASGRNFVLGSLKEDKGLEEHLDRYLVYDGLDTPCRMGVLNDTIPYEHEAYDEKLMKHPETVCPLRLRAHKMRFSFFNAVSDHDVAVGFPETLGELQGKWIAGTFYWCYSFKLVADSCWIDGKEVELLENLPIVYEVAVYYNRDKDLDYAIGDANFVIEAIGLGE